ncbi:MAG: UDP-N-acetylglucosamine 1-carboxyvinyltransferase [Oscillospiraceae bacterium]|nr:UDP-N-acetylglucosamine 1-carboxyvinyltransferase [Oscillospiraceae bacterium]
MGEVRLSTPGGCELGSRPIDLHLKALEALGAKIAQEGGEVYCKANKLIGTHINLDFPSVGATENIMLAACSAYGETVITNAAKEPEIEDLQKFLNAKGAEIEGAGSSVIRIKGFKLKEYVCHEIMPDRIVASTYLCAAAAAGGEVKVENVIPSHFSTVASSLSAMGCDITINERAVHIQRNAGLKALRPVITRPYPGFPTDAQALLMAACLKAEGTSVFVENIFESRYGHVPEMRRLGADIRTEGRVAMVMGIEELKGAPVNSCDLRGGAALILAGLSAKGETKVFDIGHVERGYEDIAGDLSRLGAEIKKE